MKFFVIAAIAISLFAPAAYAGQAGSALDALLSSAGQSDTSRADSPAVPAAAPALTSGLSDLNPAQADALAASAVSQELHHQSSRLLRATPRGNIINTAFDLF